MTMDWDALQESAAETVDVQELKRRADLVAICSALGVDLENDGDRWNGLCPFHTEDNPSFSVWFDHDKQCDRCGCWSCDFSTGDVYDFVQKKLDLSFGQATRWVKDFIENNPGKRPDPPSNGPAVDLAAYVRDAIQTAQTGNQDVATQLLADKDSRVPTGWLLREFYVGETAEEVVIPHMTPDGKTVTGVKRRIAPDWRKRSIKGSKLDNLYGAWRIKGHDTIVVCEGESDTWTVAYMLRDEDMDVVGLPSGVNQWREDWLATFHEKTVILLFDADDPGRQALRVWIERLGSARVASLREGEDATSADYDRVKQTILTAPEIGNDWDSGLLVDQHNSWVRNTNTTPPVANFTMELERVIDVGDEGYVFEVMVKSVRHRISTDDLNNTGSLSRWCNIRGLSWYGSNKDAQEVIRYLMMEAPFVPKVVGRTVAGWDGDAFVFPDPPGTLGSENAVYVAPKHDARVHDKIALVNDRFSSSVPEMLLGLHRPDVITPMIAWMAAAPLRSIAKKFPILGVTGGSGYGKTTLLQELMITFGYSGNVHVLTSTTPFAIQTLIQCTNSVPIWFDEYRLGARTDAKDMIDQVIRDSWDSSTSMKGSLKNSSVVLIDYTAHAPLIVSGEDTFTETSHIERMAVIALPHAGRDAEALKQLQSSNRAGFGYAYYNWLLDQHQNEVLPAPPDKQNRMEQVIAVLEWGWSLFESFCNDIMYIDLPNLDLSLVKKAHEDNYDRDPILDALDEFMRTHDHQGRQMVWLEGDDVCVRLQPLVQTVKKTTDIKLPGGSRAVKQWLEDKYTCYDERNVEGRYLRISGVKNMVLPGDEK